MKFKRIFVKKGDCRLWSTLSPSDRSGGKPTDVFRELFNRWTDTAYLQSFFLHNSALLASPYWKGMSIDDAIDKIQDEAFDLESEFKNIETRKPGFDHLSMSDIFESFDKDMYVLDSNKLYHKKAKPDMQNSMLRVYACEFDKAFIVTGGIIKLTHKLDKETSDKERAKMNRVLQYLNSENIYTRQELDSI